MLTVILKDLVAQKKILGVPNFVIRNFLKEYLQYPVLEFIYTNEKYKNFIFNGGSCLRICFDAPRLSEDLDFSLSKKDWNSLYLNALASEIEDYFDKKYLLKIKTKCQGKKRIYLKFPVLKELGLANDSESDWLYVKIEPSESEFSKPETQFSPVSKYGFNLIIKCYSINFLMTGKLNAILLREWFKGENNEINIKGRDFYDLFWYLQNKVSPDFRNLNRNLKIKDWPTLKMALKEKIEKNITARKLAYDLKNFFPDQSFVTDFCKNYEKIVSSLLDKI